MNPLEQRVQALENELNLLKAGATIPLEIDRAFRDRFKFIAIQIQNDKAISTETQAVNEQGTADPYNVPKLFDGLYKDENGNYIPYYTA